MPGGQTCRRHQDKIGRLSAAPCRQSAEALAQTAAAANGCAPLAAKIGDGS